MHTLPVGIFWLGTLMETPGCTPVAGTFARHGLKEQRVWRAMLEGIFRLVRPEPTSPCEPAVARSTLARCTARSMRKRAAVGFGSSPWPGRWKWRATAGAFA